MKAPATPALISENGGGGWKEQTIAVMVTNLRGGKDVTAQVLAESR